MEVIRELLIAIGIDADVAKFAEAIGLEKLLEKGAEALVEALKELPKFLIEVTKETAEYAKELEETSKLTDTNTEALQEFGYIAGLAGVSAGEMEISVGHLAKQMAAARDGNADAVKSFAALGTRVTDSTGKLRPLFEVIEDVSDGLHKQKTAGDRINLSMEVFGRQGRKMVNVLSGGKQAIAGFREEFTELGLGMDEDAIKKAAEVQTSFLKLGFVFDALKREIAGPLIDALGPLLEELLGWVKANRDLIRQRLVGFAQGVARVLRTLVGVIGTLGHTVLWLVENWKLFALIAAGVLIAIEAQTGALGLLIAEYAAAGLEAVAAGVAAALAWAEAAAPVLLLAALFAALLLIIDDVHSFLIGEDSLIGDLGPKWTKFLDTFLKPAAGDHWLVATFKQLGRLLTDFSGGWDQFVKDWKYALNQMWLAIPAPLRRFFDAQAEFFGGGSTPDASAAGSVAAAGARGGGNQFHADIQIVQQPGESGEAIAGHVSNAMEDFLNGKTREAIGALGGVQ